MSTPILVAIIAACASLFTAIVALTVARRAKKVTLVQDQFRLLLKLSDERITRLRALAAATERLRAAAMLLRSDLAATARSKSDMKASEGRRELLRNEFLDFWMRWAETKDDVPDTDMNRLRDLRHEMHHEFDRTLSVIEPAIQRGSAGNSVKEQEDAVTALGDLLLRLDAFFGEIARLRSIAVEAVILADPSAAGLVRVGHADPIARRALGEVLPSRDTFTASK